MSDLRSPREIAAGAADRLCAYDAVDAPGVCDPTTDRVAEFLREFVLIIGPRLESAAKARQDLK
jgi:hypothetical protein